MFSTIKQWILGTPQGEIVHYPIKTGEVLSQDEESGILYVHESFEHEDGSVITNKSIAGT
jgi:hypothetical protein